MPEPTLSQILILIPSRFHSTRLPGKPLLPIAGKTLLKRVWDIALLAGKYAKEHKIAEVRSMVLTEDTRILSYCEDESIAVLKTSEHCNSGTERVAEAVAQMDDNLDLVINLQGDNALCPPWFLVELIKAHIQYPSVDILTPYVQLDWPALDTLRHAKSSTPFSGTTVVFNKQLEALWFSKQILPAIRNENTLRQASKKSPVARHIGIYAYKKEVILNFSQLAASQYEVYEGLEQLTFLENGLKIHMVEVDYQGRQGMSGVDSPEDISRAEKIIADDGELI
ncbi:MAG: 3-deoxy-manno-octulosonate cytidylyltransferase (CMP-KDO synthetase) [Cellvibrionaceae bacterium]|jgi:3-deoxy-manno-octulosonate cytidylyltransferase (CMP-KDO synthetase)